MLRLLLSEEDVPPQERGPFVLQRMLLMSFLLTAIGLTERLIQYHPQYDPVLPHTKPRTISLESMQYLAPAVGAATVALGSYNIDFKLLSGKKMLWCFSLSAVCNLYYSDIRRRGVYISAAIVSGRTRGPVKCKAP